MAGDYDLSAGAPLDDEEKRQRYLDMLAERGSDAPGVSRDDAPPVTAEAPAFEYDENVTPPPVTGAAPLRAQQPDMLNGPAHQRPAAMAPAVNFPQGPRPEWKDYAPPVKHGMGRFGQILGEMFTGTPQRAEMRAERNYQNAASDYDTEVSQAAALRPKPKEEQWSTVPGMVGPKGQLVQEEKNSGQIRYAPGLEGVHPAKEQELKEGELPLAAKIPQLNQILASRYQVLNPGKPLPPEFMLGPDATQKDYDRVDKGLEAVERAQGTKAQQETANSMRQQAASLAQQNFELRKQEMGDKKTEKAKSEADKKAAPYDEVAQIADDADYYAQQKTGPADYALTMRFVEATKPKTGFRLTNTELQAIQHARSSLGDLQTLEARIANGESLSDAQRAAMLTVIHHVSEHAKKESARIHGDGGGAENASGQPKVGDEKKFPNGKTGVWDGKGWALKQ